MLVLALWAEVAAQIKHNTSHQAMLNQVVLCHLLGPAHIYLAIYTCIYIISRRCPARCRGNCKEFGMKLSGDDVCA